MEPETLYKSLWENVLTLMRKHYGEEKLGEFAKDAGIGPSSMTRIKKQETAVGIDIVCKIAGAFKVMPWQLLAPKLGEGLYYFEGHNPRPIVHSETPHAPPPGPPDNSPVANRRDDQWKRTKSGKERDTGKRPTPRTQGRRAK